MSEMNARVALEWLIQGGAGLVAFLAIAWMEKKSWGAWLNALPKDTKREAAFVLAVLLGWGAWALLRLAPGYLWPEGLWAWLDELFKTAFAIVSSQLAHNWFDVRRKRLNGEVRS